MKVLFALLAISLTAAAIPFALAIPEKCHSEPESEGMRHPTQEGHYIYIVSPEGEFEAEKFGEWVDDNGVAGLQTYDCFENGTYMSEPDSHIRGLA